MEIKILVKENERKELDKFIETCKEHGMTVTREGGGRLQNFRGYYAEFKGERWGKVDAEDRQLNIPDVSNAKRTVCALCGINKPIEGCTVCLKCMEDSVK